MALRVGVVAQLDLAREQHGVPVGEVEGGRRGDRLVPVGRVRHLGHQELVLGAAGKFF